MTFLADENFQQQAVRLLEAFDQQNSIRHLTEVFERGEKDVKWLGSAGKMEPKPIILSDDGRILRNTVERTALRSSNLTFVHLAPGWTNLGWPEFAWKIVRVWPAILESTRRVARPSVSEVKVGNLAVALVSQTARL